MKCMTMALMKSGMLSIINRNTTINCGVTDNSINSKIIMIGETMTGKMETNPMITMMEVEKVNKHNAIFAIRRVSHTVHSLIIRGSTSSRFG